MSDHPNAANSTSDPFGGASPIHDWCEWMERERSQTASAHRRHGRAYEPGWSAAKESQLLRELDEIAALSSVQADAEIDALLRAAALTHPASDAVVSEQEMADRVLNAWRGEKPDAIQSIRVSAAEPNRRVSSGRSGWQWLAASAGAGAALALASILFLAWLHGPEAPSLAERAPEPVQPSDGTRDPLEPARPQVAVKQQTTPPGPGSRPPTKDSPPESSEGLAAQASTGHETVSPEPVTPSRNAIVKQTPMPPVTPAESPESAIGWKLVSSANAEAPTWGAPLPSNQQLAHSTLRLLKGAATLVWPNVGEVTIHGPAEFRPEAKRLFLRHGELMARVMTPTRIDTPGSQLEIIDRASVYADEYGTAVRASGAVGITSKTRPSTVMAPGSFRWISAKGEVYDWLVTMIEAEGSMVLAVNDQLCAVNSGAIRQPGAIVTATLAQMSHRGLLDSDSRGALLVNGVEYNFRGVRGIQQVGLRVNDQFLQRYRAAKAKGNDFFINGLTLLQHNVVLAQGDGDFLGGVGPIAHDAASRLFDQQLRMIETMSRTFPVDLSSVRRAVEQARAASAP